MMLGQSFAGTTLLASDFDAQGAQAQACAGRAAGGWRVALINKDAARDLDVVVDLGRAARGGRVWRLTGPSLEATSGVSLAGGEVTRGDARWAPERQERLAGGRALALRLPRASAALLFVDG